MDMTQTLNAQLAMMMNFTLMPTLAQARRAQRSKIKLFMPESDNARRTDATRSGERI